MAETQPPVPTEAQIAQSEATGERQSGIELSVTGGSVTLAPGISVHLPEARGVQVGDHNVQYVGVPSLVPPEGSRAGQIIEALLGAGFEAPRVLAGLVSRSRKARLLVVTGGAGSGKSTVLAALCRPDTAPGVVPGTATAGAGEVFVHAAVFVDATTTERSLAYEIRDQLLISLPTYRVGLAAFEQHNPDQWATADPLAQYVAGPLRTLAANPLHHGGTTPGPGQDAVDPIRIVIDGLDQVTSPAADGLIGHLLDLATDPDLAQLRLIIGLRDPRDASTQAAAPNDPDAAESPGYLAGGRFAGAGDLAAVVAAGSVLRLPAPSVEVLTRYLTGRGLPVGTAQVLAPLCAQGGGAWLLARLLAGTITQVQGQDRTNLITRLQGAATARERDTIIADLYDRIIEDLLTAWVNSEHHGTIPDTQHQSERDEHWRTGFRSILTPLVVAGAGPVNPIRMVAAVSGIFNGPSTPDGVRTVLDRLTLPDHHDHHHHGRGGGSLIVRVDPGQDSELLGLFHPTLAAHLAQRPEPGRRRIDVSNGRRILLDRIEALTPVKGSYTDNPLARWAADAEAEHLWAHGDTHRALRSLSRRQLPTPREELARWTRWNLCFTQRHGSRHPDTLTTRHQMAFWTGETGDGVQALALYRELLPDLVDILGPHNPNTLIARGNIATTTWVTGDAVQALALLQELLPDQEAVLGLHHPDTLTTRANIAAVIGETGDAVQALTLLRELLPDRATVLGTHHPDTLTTRSNITNWTGQTGDVVQALTLSWELLPDRVAVLGPYHPDTLTTRANIAAWTGEIGDAEEALALLRALLPDMVAVLGPHHPDTLTIRGNIAYWTGETGDGAQALALNRELLPDRVAVLGPRHPDTLTTRNNIAAWTGQTGDPAGALTLFRELLPDQVAVLGPHHPATLTTRSNIAGWTGQTGDAAQALTLFRELLPDLVAVLGPHHPDTLATQREIARLEGQEPDGSGSVTAE